MEKTRLVLAKAVTVAVKATQKVCGEENSGMLNVIKDVKDIESINESVKFIVMNKIKDKIKG